MHLSFVSHHRSLSFPLIFAQPARAAITESAVFKEIAALRYDVYCLERGYLDSRQYPENAEVDEFDDRSTHIAAYTRDNLLVGTVRLVRAGLSQVFPLETRCSFFKEFDLPPKPLCGEVSRLIVRKNFRGGGPVVPDRRGVLQATQPLQTGAERRSSSAKILLGLFREMYQHSRNVGIRYWFAAMEKPLARSLNQMGFQFTPAGPETDYSGPVTPFVADLDKLMAILGRVNPSLSSWFERGANVVGNERESRMVGMAT
jgi:N-acyl amino acid synthase of PEP-CTERM/exosortase system